MVLTVQLILMVLALICFFCAAINRPAASPVSLGWLGLFFWSLDILIRVGS